MPRNNIQISFIFFCIYILILACNKSSTAGTAPDCSLVMAKSFAADVNPLIQTYCNQAGCHNTGSGNKPGPLTNFTQVYTSRGSIRTQVLSGQMPQNTTLTAAQKNSIICWIDSGAPNN